MKTFREGGTFPCDPNIGMTSRYENDELVIIPVDNTTDQLLFRFYIEDKERDATFKRLKDNYKSSL